MRETPCSLFMSLMSGAAASADAIPLMPVEFSRPSRIATRDNLREDQTAGEIDVILKSSIFIAGTSAVPGKS
jgi:hypothetical protein